MASDEQHGGEGVRKGVDSVTVIIRFGIPLIVGLAIAGTIWTDPMAIGWGSIATVSSAIVLWNFVLDWVEAAGKKVINSG